MPRDYTIAEARDHFADVVRKAEAGEEAIVTRRGKPVAVVVSHSRYALLREGRAELWPRLKEWREDLDQEGLDVAADVWSDVRGSSSGRSVDLE